MVIGLCRLCARQVPLSYEHIPPKRCFNSSQVILETIESNSRRAHTRENFRRGMGKQSLCSYCNSKTADLYGEYYFRWYSQALSQFDKASANKLETLSFTIFPLMVIKQIATMLIAMMGEASVDLSHIRALRRFILTKGCRDFPTNIIIGCYLAEKDHPRLSSTSARMDVETGRFEMVFSEVALWPLGYCFLSNNLGERAFMIDNGICDIT